MKKRALAMAAALSLGTMAPAVQVPAAKQDTWAIYWYLCGSDLESEYGAGTMDLQEMMKVSLPSNVKVIIETGGSKKWRNSFTSKDKLGRYLYEGKKLYQIEEKKKANMGDSSTLADFLSFCQTNYPADHEAVIFWNHGGGTTQGVSFDENYGYDSLTLDEMHKAFEQVYDLSTENPPLELVGFDACLMATIDTASTFSDIASYMVASEETEPGNGWNYTGFLNALAKNPSMNGAQLGKEICDSFLSGCKSYRTDGETTLSVTDLSRIPTLVKEVDALGKEAITRQSSDASFYTSFSRNTEKAESYGVKSKYSGYTNLVDLGDMVRMNQNDLPKSSDRVLKALDEAIVYRVNGKYRQKATGLSCYYSFNKDLKDFKTFASASASPAFREFYHFALTGEVTDDLAALIEQTGIEEAIQEVITLEYVDTSDLPVYLDEDGYATLEVSQETMDAITGVYFVLSYLDDSDYMIWLGNDNNLDMDWENGIFKDNFEGTWGAIDGHYCYMEVADETDEYTLFLIPILLNGENYQLHVAYDYDKEDFEILGARKDMEEKKMADKNLVQLQVGDTVSTLVYAGSVEGNDELELTEFETFKVKKNTRFEEADLGDGNFVMMFQLVDTRGDYIWSDPVLFQVEDGEINPEVISSGASDGSEPANTSGNSGSSSQQQYEEEEEPYIYSDFGQGFGSLWMDILSWLDEPVDDYGYQNYGSASSVNNSYGSGDSAYDYEDDYSLEYLDEKMYKGQWLSFENLFELYLPANWKEPKISREEAENGLIYYLEARDGSAIAVYEYGADYMQSVGLADSENYYEYLSEDGNLSDLSWVMVNGFEGIYYQDMNNDTETLAMFGDKGTCFEICFYPVSDSEMHEIARNVMNSFCEAQ